MKVSGFYKTIGNDLTIVKASIERKFNKRTSPILEKTYGENFFQITEVIRTREWEKEGFYKAFNVHFILDIPRINVAKGSELFCNLQEIVLSGLDIIQ